MVAGRTAKRLRILVSAYACEPYKGSEQGVGWNWVLELSKTNDVWVITRSNNRETIESALPQDAPKRIHFFYYDLPERWRRYKRKEKRMYLYYALWQWGAYNLAKELNEEQHFDYCQHLTFGSMWMPTFIYRLPIPFIWGPIGGGEAIPLPLISTLPWRSRFVHYARYILIHCAMFNPLFRLPAQAARSIIARTEDSARVFSSRYISKVSVVLETGMSEDQMRACNPISGGRTAFEFKLIYTGRLVASKNVAMGLRAFALARSAGYPLHLTIIGDGPLSAGLAGLAESLGVLKQVDFLGTVQQHNVISLLQESDAFLFPSLKEGGTWSLIEAMAVGLPIICINSTGMKVITNDACAFRIQPDKPELMEQRMADAIIALAEAPELRKRMAIHARKRIEENFLWQQKGNFIRDLFAKLEGDQQEAQRQ